MILLVTNSRDRTADFIETKVPGIYRFNTDRLFQDYRFSFTGEDWRIWNRNTDLSIGASSIRGGYYRRPTVPELDLTDAQPNIAAALREEAYEIYNSMLETFTCKWLCDPINTRFAENRLEQLRVAKQVGFDIPKYAFTNDEAFAVKFVRNTDRACIKPISMRPVRMEDQVLCFYNSIVSETDLQRLSGVPVQLQSYIGKLAEFRVVVVGASFHVVKILSQKKEDTAFDWRVGNCQLVDYEIGSIPREISERCMSLVEYFKISFACIDLILGTDGKYYFLDLNPNGQWVWLEELLHLGIYESISEYFCG